MPHHINLDYMFFFYKHNVYKHTEPDIWRKIKHAKHNAQPYNLRFELKFFFEFNQSTIEEYAFINEINAIFSLLPKLRNH